MGRGLVSTKVVGQTDNNGNLSPLPASLFIVNKPSFVINLVLDSPRLSNERPVSLEPLPPLPVSTHHFKIDRLLVPLGSSRSCQKIVNGSRKLNAMAENDRYVSNGASSSSSTASSFVNEDGAGSNSSAISVSPDGKISRDSATVFTDGATSSSAKARASVSTDKPPMTSATANAPVLTDDEVIDKSVLISEDGDDDDDDEDDDDDDDH